MHVELLYFQGCPNWLEVRSTLEELNSETEFTLQLTEVPTPEAAKEIGFLGSPSIRVDGNDVLTTGQEQVGYACRLYEGATNIPSKAALKQALIQG